MRTNLWLLVLALAVILVGGSQAHLNTLTRHLTNCGGLALAAVVALDLWTLVRDEIRLRQEERRARIQSAAPAPEQA